MTIYSVPKATGLQRLTDNHRAFFCGNLVKWHEPVSLPRSYSKRKNHQKQTLIAHFSRGRLRRRILQCSPQRKNYCFSHALSMTHSSPIAEYGIDIYSLSLSWHKATALL